MKKSTIYKRAIIDGYNNCWNLFGNIPFGMGKYDDMNHKELMFYYGVMGVASTITFVLIILSMLLLLYSATSNAVISISQAMTIYILIMSPMLYQALKNFIGFFNEKK